MSEMYPGCQFKMDSNSLILQYDILETANNQLLDVDFASLFFTLSIIVPCAFISGYCGFVFFILKK